MEIPHPDTFRKPHPGTAAVERQPPARLRLLAARLHSLGERPLFEFLAEVIAGADPVMRLEAYARIDGRILDALDGRDLPRLRAVGSRR